jgi:lipopolysaccharide/colanic/teichoic acid biosynthesis glycosyltransferase
MGRRALTIARALNQSRPFSLLDRIEQGLKAQPGKRAFDLMVAPLLLLLITPLLIVTAFAIKIFDGGPILYRQRRVGRDGVPFEMLKFRSMVVGADRLIIELRDRNIGTGLLFKVHSDPRVTKLGRIIRRLSIDELPQLWNVIRGQMSLVGPRPLPAKAEDFDQVQGQRHMVRPGITGYWQIARQSRFSYEEMVKLDLAYVSKWSLVLDISLLLRTMPALVRRRGHW